MFSCAPLVGGTASGPEIKIIYLSIYLSNLNLRFVRFLQLGGSKWAEMVLYEQGVPFRRSGHPTCLYSDQIKIRPIVGPKN